MKIEKTLKEKIQRIEKIAFIAVFVISLFGGIVFGYINAEIKNYSGIANLKRFQPSMPTRLYDVNGELIAELFLEKRDLVSYEELPPSLVNAFLSAEDNGFFTHFGIDYSAITRAMFKNLIASAKNLNIMVVQGGSTITQQLAKRLFTSSERTFARKALEAVLALQIEKKFSKEEILEMYFNQIFLGSGCYGISTAADFYYEKDVKYLSVAESSVLAALPARPNGYSPLKNPKGAYEKNQDTLRRMVSNGYLTETKAKQISEEFWKAYIDKIKDEFPTKTALTKSIDNAPYFTDYVRQVLTARFGKDFVYNEGLSVYTTLDLRRQKIGEKYLKEGVNNQDEISSKANLYMANAVDSGLIGAYHSLASVFSLAGVITKNDDESIFRKQMADDIADAAETLSLFVDAPAVGESIEAFRNVISGISTQMRVEGAFIAIEPTTGYITTMVGGSEFEVGNQFNRAMQAKRQPGSSFKPFVYGAGIESKKMTTATIFPDVPIVDIDAGGSTWAPGNYEGTYSGMMPVFRALPASINIISVRIYDVVGADTVISYAAKMLKAPEGRFNPSPSLALGTTEVTPFEMATAYAIYANRGREVIPFAVRYVADKDGNDILNIEEEVGNIIAYKEMNGTIQVISEEVAWIMTDLMRGTVDRGTAVEPIRGRAGFKKQAAGKTGTTSNWTDAWFCGYTNDLVAIVWLGYDRPFMSMGKHQAGAGIAAPIWAYYMRDIYNGLPDPAFPPMPKGVAASGGGYGLPGAVSQYYEGVGPDGKPLIMKSVLDRYLEKEGLVTE